MSLSSLFSWLLANYGQLLALAAVVIASASILIKALEVLVHALVAVFPGLKTADGKLVQLAAWLDALAQAKWLNLLAASPKPAAPAPSAVVAPK